MKAYDRIRVDQWFLASIGVLLLCVALVGIVYAGRASLAAQLACSARYGAAASNVEYVLDSCRQAYVLYPWNYYFSILAAEAAYYSAGNVPDEVRARRLQQAELWCERGLIQNQYRSQLRRLKTRFLWETSPSEAIAYWTAYTDWQYWEPYNHQTLAEYYAKYGEFEQAERELKLIAHFPAYESTRKFIESEKANWIE
jgi:hypothetical protein